MPAPAPFAQRFDGGLAPATRRPARAPTGAPLRVALISNPTSGRNAHRGLLSEVRGLLRARPRVAHFERTSYAGLVDAATSAVADETDVVAVNGGDGTVQAVLTSMLASSAPHLPVVAVLAGGTTNTTARNVGYGGTPRAALERLLDEAARGTLAGTVEARPVVRADLGGGTQYGMMFGAGGVYHGIRLARDELAARGVRGRLGAGVALATFLGKALTGGGGALFPPLHADIEVDGARLEPTAFVGMLVSTMDRQLFGVRPYWGTGPGPLRVSTLAHRPRHLARAVIPALRGRPNRWLRPEFGYQSLNADEVTVSFTGGFTLDGELFEPARSPRPLRLSAHEVAYFLRT